MNNAERELQKRNQEKERMEEANYEIPYIRNAYFDCTIENEDIVYEFCK